MKLIDDLRREHDTIERVALSAIAAAGRDVDAFRTFFETFGAWHHAREEQILFQALVDADLPRERGPIAVLTQQHATMADLMREGRMVEYAHALLKHIDAENSVLFPESELRLKRELPAAAAGEREAEALALAERLTTLYPPAEAVDLVRGEGCIMCDAFGDTCRGLEREWWNEWEWEQNLIAAD